jgi:hypothetical protein
MNAVSWTDRLLASVARGVVIPFYGNRFRRFERQLDRTAELQREQWMTRVARSRDTRFGRDHHFAGIRTLEDFRRQIPVAGYEYFAPYIDALARGDHESLLPASERLLRFTITTGTTGVPKLNPVTATWMKEHLDSWDLWNIKMVLDHPEMVGRKVLQLAGTWDMGRTASGVPISMVSSLVSHTARPIVRHFYALPNVVADIREPIAKNYTILRLAMTQNVGLVASVSPGNLVRLAEIGNSESRSLIRDIHDGTLSSAYDVPDPIRRQLQPYVSRPAPHEAQQLERMANERGVLHPRDYWSNPVIGCWLGGTAGFQSRYLPDYYGPAPLRDLGLVSSEGRHTIPIHDHSPPGVLAVTTNYYEFIPLDERNSQQPIALEAHELEVGHDYSLVMTTSAGIFRYEIGDVMRCQGFLGTAPVLEFLQKLGRCADLEGEKLTEHQFVQAANEAADEMHFRLGFVTAVPCRPQQASPCYVILAELPMIPVFDRARQFLAALDRRLIAGNFLYSAHRKSQVLGSPRLWRLPEGTWAQYQQAEMARRGTGDMQYKHPALVTDGAFLSRFTAVDVVELPQSGDRRVA